MFRQGRNRHDIRCGSKGAQDPYALAPFLRRPGIREALLVISLRGSSFSYKCLSIR